MNIHNNTELPKFEVYVMGYDPDHLNFKPEVWICAHPAPFKEKPITIIR